MSNLVEIDLVSQPTQSTDLALEDLMEELDENLPRTTNTQARIDDASQH